jgi:hypothetical protein
MELIGERVPITRDNLIDKLEHNRRETGNVIGNGMLRDAAEMVRKGKIKTRRGGRAYGFLR